MDGTDTERYDTASTVLVVDDTAAGRYALAAVLRRAGHRVVAVACAHEALTEIDARLRAGTLPDLALVDVGLPDMSGFELCRRLKDHPATAALPVVHYSAASAEPGYRYRGLDVGGEAFLSLPAEPEEIQAVVRAAVRGARVRVGAETLARRLTLLSETIVAVQGARCLTELAGAAAEGTARLTGTPAAVFVLTDDGDLYHGVSRGPGLPLTRPRATGPSPDLSSHRAVTGLIRSFMNGHTGVRSAVVPAPLWPAGFFRPGASDDARLVLARTHHEKAPVCLAVPAGNGAPAADPQTESLVARLAQATALAAEPLLMYQVERHVALTLQHSFLPQPHRLPELPGVDVVVRYVPASRQTEIGGDFYAALSTGDGVLTAVGDVVGHSLDAATVMVELRHALRAYCVEESDPALLAGRLDRMLQRYHPDVTTTVCLALVDPASGRVKVANAGHIPPLIIGDDGTASYVKACGPLLGLGLPHPAPTETVLMPTDRLLMVTDGLIETRGTDLAVSMEQLRTAAADAPLGVDALCDTLLDCFGRDREDDIALLALRLG
ncbi:SpoIIE family protein phosphatase [Streptomyces sp. NPDC059786]|uniref:SpoIIE family protein phosphatase n=1 Tax=Streptomyces sp. NPDC059786 TaxID=3346946 RepID=UPI0036675C10